MPDIIVTPGGNYWEDDNDDSWNSNPNDSESFDFDNYFHSGGGNQSGKSDDQLIADGIKVLNAMCDSIRNGTAIYLEKDTTKITDSNAFKLANITNYGMNFALSEMDVYSTIYNQKTVLKSFGGALGAANAAAGGVIAFFAVFDRDTTESDKWGAAAAVLSIVGYGVGYFYPPAALVIGGLSIICGAISLATSGNQNSNQSNSNYQ
ncbi:MAG: hypothetical protein K1W41_27775 [Lachnospiraceae bacterium]